LNSHPIDVHVAPLTHIQTEQSKRISPVNLVTKLIAVGTLL